MFDEYLVNEACRSSSIVYFDQIIMTNLDGPFIFTYVCTCACALLLLSDAGNVKML